MSVTPDLDRLRTSVGVIVAVSDDGVALVHVLAAIAARLRIPRHGCSTTFKRVSTVMVMT
jgi:hypothetical protein